MLGLGYVPCVCTGKPPVQTQLFCTSDVTMLGVMQLRLGSMEFIVKYLLAITGKTCTTIVNMKPLFTSRIIPLLQMRKALGWNAGTYYSQIEYVDNNSTVSNIVCAPLYHIHNGRFAYVLSLRYSRCCPRARAAHNDVHDSILVDAIFCDINDDIHGSSYVTFL